MMKRNITDEGFRAFLETLSWHELYWTSRCDIHPKKEPRFWSSERLNREAIRILESIG